MASWIDGWELNFLTEDLMLNNQTFFICGWNTTSEYTQFNDPWWLGNISIEILGWRFCNFNFEEGDKVKDWEFTDDWAEGYSYMNYDIDPMLLPTPSIQFRYKLFHTERFPLVVSAHKYPWPVKKSWIYGQSISGSFGGPLKIGEYFDKNGDGYVRLDGYVWCKPLFGALPMGFALLTNYRCHINNTGSNDPGSGVGSYYWEEDCAYMNSTTADVDSHASFGITYVDVNISSFLIDNEYIYTWRGYSGDTRINILC